MITKIVGRTPRECVDWNNHIQVIFMEFRCRTPRECVDWNSSMLSGSKKVDMSHSSWVRGLKPYLLVFNDVGNKRSHSSWVRGLKQVEYYSLAKTLTVALLVSAWIETSIPCYNLTFFFRRTPRECVDWNLYLLVVFLIYERRTPRECVDWNFLSCILAIEEAKSHSSWVRGLKPVCFAVQRGKCWQVALLVSAWIETSPVTE